MLCTGVLSAAVAGALTVASASAVVVQIYDIKMRDWKAMIPMLEAQLAKKEASAIQNLERTLNSSNTPLANVVLATEDLKHKYKPKHPAPVQQRSAWDMETVSSNLGSVFSGMFAKNTAQASASGSSSGATPSGYSTQAERQASVTSDVLGYYRVLGLNASSLPTTDQIKSAFRKAAMQVHPDKLVSHHRTHRVSMCAGCK
jgi:hypothetical protein